MSPMRVLVRGFLAVATAVVVLLGTVTARCVDIGGVPSWERCNSFLNTPIVEWPGGDLALLIPLTISVVAGFVVWRLLGRVME